MIFTPVGELAALVRAREISPVELAEHCLERLERLGPKYNCVVTVMRQHALTQARRAEGEIAAGRYRGPLHGIPYGAKDLLATAGAPTTWGAAPYKAQHFDFDATVIRRLEEAGAVLVAKLAMIELAGGMGYRQPTASFTGRASTRGTRTPGRAGHQAGLAPQSVAGSCPSRSGRRRGAPSSRPPATAVSRGCGRRTGG